MGTTNINGQQITINVSDSIPPENIATIDKGALVGNTKSKEQLEVWQTEVEEKIDKVSSSGIKGEATPTSSPTPYNPTDYPKGLYEKWEVRTAGTYTNFKDGANPPQPIVVSASDLDKKLVYINVNNGISKKDTIAIPGAAIDSVFDVTHIDKAQNAYNVNSWLVNTVVGGASDDVSQTIEEVGDFYKNIGITLVGTNQDGLQAGLYNVKTNTTCIADANKYLTKGFINLAVAGSFRIGIGSYDGTKFNIRWQSDDKTGVVGWNNYDFTSEKIKINTGEMPVVICSASSTAFIRYGDPGATGNRFVQYSTTSGMAQAGAGSYYSLYFELKDVKVTTLPSNSIFNLSKSVSKIVDNFSKNGYTGAVKTKGQSVVSSDTDMTEGYAINKIALETSYVLDKLEINTSSAGVYNIAIGFIEQAGKFIEKKTISKNLIAGVNTIIIDPVILVKGDYVGLKFPGKYPVNNSPADANLWATNSYTGSLMQISGKSLPIKLFLKEYIESPIATKEDLQPINSSIIGLQQNFIYNGKKVKLTFNAGGAVSWEYLVGYSSILHLGNSIAKHPVLSYWWGSWGMAASEKSKDYVNRFLSKMQNLKPTATTDVLNIAGWESNPSTWDKSQLDSYLLGKDLICIRLGENATYSGTFKAEFASLISYIKTKNTTAKILIGGVFWADNNKDTAMTQVAAENNMTFVKLSHLDSPSNRSYMGAQVKGDDGQWHTVNNTGVAAHPSDAGMDAIANELFNALGL